ncbi:hypothetical protein BC628DRAFT_569500 [Trametes gibbosa]|nr:hypothetical protein BC628DRAFT_569500 [Trametes gibbosa]
MPRPSCLVFRGRHVTVRSRTDHTNHELHVNLRHSCMSIWNIALHTQSDSSTTTDAGIRRLVRLGDDAHWVPRRIGRGSFAVEPGGARRPHQYVPPLPLFLSKRQTRHSYKCAVRMRVSTTYTSGMIGGASEPPSRFTLVGCRYLYEPFKCPRARLTAPPVCRCLLGWTSQERLGGLFPL